MQVGGKGGVGWSSIVNLKSLNAPILTFYFLLFCNWVGMGGLVGLSHEYKVCKCPHIHKKPQPKKISIPTALFRHRDKIKEKHMKSSIWILFSLCNGMRGRSNGKSFLSWYLYFPPFITSIVSMVRSYTHKSQIYDGRDTKLKQLKKRQDI